jgi:transposase
MHQATIVATVRVPDDAGGRRVVTHTFETMTVELLALREWLQAFGVTHVAMKSTGVYWKPISCLLEDDFTLLLVNMQHVNQVPGRKTDVKDSGWPDCSNAACRVEVWCRWRRLATCAI